MTVPRYYASVLDVVQEGYSIPCKTSKVGRQSFFPPKIAIQVFEPSQLHLPAYRNHWLSSEQLFVGLVRFGIFAPSCADPRQLKHILSAVVLQGNYKPLGIPLASLF